VREHAPSAPLPGEKSTALHDRSSTSYKIALAILLNAASPLRKRHLQLYQVFAPQKGSLFLPFCLQDCKIPFFFIPIPRKQRREGKGIMGNKKDGAKSHVS
jgi:hypothetical protein